MLVLPPVIRGVKGRGVEERKISDGDMQVNSEGGAVPYGHVRGHSMCTAMGDRKCVTCLEQWVMSFCHCLNPTYVTDRSILMDGS